MPLSVATRRSATCLLSGAARLVAAAAAASVLCFGASGLLAAPASAHPTLIGSEPRDGALVSAPLAEVSLAFNDRIEAPAFLSVTGPGGTRADSGSATVSGRTVAVRLHPLRTPGAYTLAYRVVSSDGHPVTARLHFTVTAAATAGVQEAGSTAPPAGLAAPASIPPQRASGNWLHVLAGAVVVVGGAVILMRSRRRDGVAPAP